MNPVLLKPGTDSRSQVVVLGRPVGEMEARAYWNEKASLLDVVVEAYRRPPGEIRRRDLRRRGEPRRDQSPRRSTS